MDISGNIGFTYSFVSGIYFFGGKKSKRILFIILKENFRKLGSLTFFLNFQSDSYIFPLEIKGWGIGSSMSLVIERLPGT